MKYREKITYLKLVALVLTICLISVIVVVSCFPSLLSRIVESPAPNESESVNVLGSKVDEIIGQYESTFRNCLGPNCFDEKVIYKGDKHVHRIGFLALPNSGADTIYNFVSQFMGKRKLDSGIDLILESNVPAYGYGKNHGWSRIVRVRRRLIPHALSLLTRIGISSSEDITELFRLQVSSITH